MSNPNTLRSPALNLEQQRKRAKDLVRAYRRGSAEDVERVQRQLPRTPALELTLGEAQLVVAREAGFSSWGELKRQLERQSASRQISTVLRAALAGDTSEVKAQLARDPQLAHDSLHLSCALGDSETALRLLDADRARASAPLDGSGHLPLVCACAARFGRGASGMAASRIRIATRLLELGADPNQPHADARSPSGWSWPIEGAVEAASVELLEILLQGGAAVVIPSSLVGNVSGPLPLQAAVRGGSVACLERVLAARPALWEARDALELAIERNQIELVQLLLRYGAAPDKAGRHWGHWGGALHSALLLGRSLDVLRLLLDHGASVTVRDHDGRTPLAVAVRTAQRAAGELLQASGASDNEVDALDYALGACIEGNRGDTSAFERDALKRTDHQLLCWALRNSRHAALPALLALGLDPNIADDDGETPLSLALAENDMALRTQLVEQLTAAGAVPNQKSELPEELFELAVDAVVDGDIDGLRDLLDEEPRLVAARSRRAHRAALLHYVGANGIEQERQRTPPNIVAIVELLLERGADVNALANTYGGGPGQTPLGLSVTSCFPEEAGVMEALVLTLVKHGANPNGLDDTGDTLAGAIGERRSSAVRALARAGARIDKLPFAAALRDHERLRSLLPMAPPEQRAGALIVAAQFGLDDVVRFLAEHGVALGATDNQGFTALHWAAFHGYLNVVQVLLEYGAPTETKNVYGGTALGTALWAAKNTRLRVDHAPVLEALLAKGADVRSAGGPWGLPALDAILQRHGATW